MTAGTTSSEWLKRIANCLHTLDYPPTGSAWNHTDLADLLVENTNRIEAAVLVALIERNDQITVLLTRRTTHLAKHAGQISFPGGRIEDSDFGPANAAMREAFEEVGISPEWIEPLGFLDPLETISNYRVVPLVAKVRAGFEITLNADEVDEVFETPLSVFLDHSFMTSREVEYQGKVRTIHEFVIEGRTIWGATASIMMNLRARLELSTS